MYDMKKDAKSEVAHEDRAERKIHKMDMKRSGHMEHKIHHPGGNESYGMGAAGKVGLYLKNMGRSKGY